MPACLFSGLLISNSEIFKSHDAPHPHPLQVTVLGSDQVALDPSNKIHLEGRRNNSKLPMTV